MKYTRMHYVRHRSVVAPSHPRTIEVGGARPRRALALRRRAPTGSDQRHEECVARGVMPLARGECHGMRWDGMGWDGMGWDGMGWDDTPLIRLSRHDYPLCTILPCSGPLQWARSGVGLKPSAAARPRMSAECATSPSCRPHECASTHTRNTKGQQDKHSHTHPRHGALDYIYTHLFLGLGTEYVVTGVHVLLVH